MVAVRSAGLSFESIIGVVRNVTDRQKPLENGAVTDIGEEITEALVDEEYIERLVLIANERFEANSERMRRFEESLFGGKSKDDEWEGKEDRRERKRKEGLMKKEASKVDSVGKLLNGDYFDEGMGIGAFENVT